MAKTPTIGAIITAFILLIALGSLPNDSVTDTSSAVKNAGGQYVTDVKLDASKQVIDQLSEQSIQNACEDPQSASCVSTRNSISIISIAWIILISGIILDGLVGYTKWIIRIVESILG